VRQIFPFSSIRTLTVGFGITPNLLTPPIARRALAGFGDRSPFTAGGDFHPAPRTRSDRNPTNAINALLAKPCNDFLELLDHAEPTDRFSTANDYYPTACDSCRGGTWVRTPMFAVFRFGSRGPTSARCRSWAPAVVGAHQHASAGNSISLADLHAAPQSVWTLMSERDRISAEPETEPCGVASRRR
jgi:hypothetical protein